jgi:hypothetical protein
MLIEQTETSVYEQSGNDVLVSHPAPAQTMVTTDLAHGAEMYEIYENIAQARPGTRDAEIFAKLREWMFSDFQVAPHDVAGITEDELEAWQTRHRINLSSGHIQPAAIDLERGHAWGTIRRFNHVNNIHAHVGPPSADELAMDLTGYSR